MNFGGKRKDTSSKDKAGSSAASDSREASVKGRPRGMLEVIEQMDGEDTKVQVVPGSLTLGAEDISRLEAEAVMNNSQDRSGMLSEGMSMFNY